LSLARKHAEPISKITYSSIPPEVIDKTKMLIAHCLGSACIGQDEKWTKSAQQTLLDFGIGGSANIWFSSLCGNAIAASYVNGVASQSSGQEDVHRESAAHAGIIVIPAALSLAGALKSSGEKLITAIVAGYEFICRIGRGGSDPEINRRGFRPTTVFGVFGACVAASVLFRLSTEEMISAIGIAGNYCCGVNEWSKAGTDDIFIQNGLCASSGVLAAATVKNGFRGSEYIFEGSDGKSGICNAFGIGRNYLEDSMPFKEDFQMIDVVCKVYPSCLFTQTTARLAEMAIMDGIKAKEIKSGTIWTATKAKEYGNCDNPGPFLGLLQARNSHQYVVSSALIHGEISNKSFADFQNPEIAELAIRFTLESKPEIDEVYPLRQAGEMKLVLNDGQVKKYSAKDAIWLKDTEIWQLAKRNMETRLPRNNVENIINTVDKLEKMEQVNNFTKLLTNSDASHLKNFVID